MANKDTVLSGFTALTTDLAFGGVGYLASLRKVSSPFESDLLDPEDRGSLQSNVPSLFNKFTVFQYADLYAGFKYRPEGHFIGFHSNLKKADEYVDDSNSQYIRQRATYEKNLDIAQKEGVTVLAEDLKKRIEALDRALPGQQEKARAFVENQQIIPSNPTAKRLVEWGSSQSAASTIGFQPYSYSDFMFCKYYGKIPNNRLITLRRYPFPVDDSLRLSSAAVKKNAIPIAQAVTWFGGETKNTLNGLGLFKWDIPWYQEVDAVSSPTGQDIRGNEVTLNELSALFSNITGGDKIASVIQTAYNAALGNDATLQQASGFEKKVQDFQKNLYDQTSGPYWNRIYGPVNVISKSSRRDRGIQNQNWKTSFSINFHYSFRSFNGLSPKIVALDLISNFMNLTYQDAQFLNQLARYFPKTGIKFDPTTTEAIGQILTNWGTTFSGNNTEEYGKILGNIYSALSELGAKGQADILEIGKKAITTSLMNPKLLGQAMPELISIRSALSDRPIGEWHLVVGNPVNPIFVMGDLICKSAEMVWDDELGPDDFPTGCTFTVTLAQGKPRDKTAIERMLNHGQTKITAGMLRTSASDDTFGEENNKLWNNITTNDSLKSDSEKLEKVFEGLKGNAQRLKGFNKFRNRFLQGYGFAGVDDKSDTLTTNSTLDTSLLLMYYQRQYGNN